MSRKITLCAALLAVLVGCSAPAARLSEASAVRVAPQELLDLQFFVNVVGAEILIDGELWATVMDTGPQNYRVPPGMHSVEIRSAGYKPFRAGIRTSPGNRHHLLVRLEPVPGAESGGVVPLSDVRTGPSLVGTLIITVEVPAASIYVDGRLYAVTASPGEAHGFGAVTGEHKVVVKAPGYEEFAASVFVTDRNTHRVFAQLVPKDRDPQPAAEPPAKTLE